MDTRYSNAVKLLADLLKWPRFRIEEAFEHKDDYQLRHKRKRGGGSRIIHAPHPILKKFQRRLLDYFLCRIGVDASVIGFRPQTGYISNARFHASDEANYFLRLDFRDAFPSVTAADLRPVMRSILLSELSEFGQRNWCNFRPLFPKTRVGWFKRFIPGKNHQKVTGQIAILDWLYKQMRLFDDSWYDDIETLIDKFVELILALTTYEGRLTQGAPSSPWLLNVYFQHSGLFGKIQNFLAKKRVFLKHGSWSHVHCSIYADDISISSSNPIEPDVINGLIGLIEKNSCFRVNRSKTRYYKMASTAPMVTGLRIARITIRGSAVARFYSKIEKGQLYFYMGLGKQRRLRKQAELPDGKWTYTQVRAPRKLIRQVRGLIRLAGLAGDPQLRERANGYIANLRAIYPYEMPSQITRPLKKFLKIDIPEPKPTTIGQFTRKGGFVGDNLDLLDDDELFF